MKMESKILGILGGGQLGRMSALAAARLGITTHIYCPESGCPASLVTPHFTCAEYDDKEALKNFADQVDVISYEFENIPLETVEFLTDLKPVYPGTKLLEVSQDRTREKAFLNEIGIETTRWAPCENPGDISTTLETWQTSKCIIKTARFGYDGKGQIKLDVKDNIPEKWAELNTQHAVIEEIINFDFEVSVVTSRDLMGNIQSYPPVLNDHKNHILSKTTYPAPLSDTLSTQAVEMAETLGAQVNLVGVLTLELFVTKDGRLLANEIAPRTHNSGHWTIDACAVSQFEQHVRAVCGLPVADPAPYQQAEMINLIGDDVKDIPKYLETPGACVHLYGKTESRPSRKMGHVTILKNRS